MGDSRDAGLAEEVVERAGLQHEHEDVGDLRELAEPGHPIGASAGGQVDVKAAGPDSAETTLESRPPDSRLHSGTSATVCRCTMSASSSRTFEAVAARSSVCSHAS